MLLQTHQLSRSFKRGSSVFFAVQNAEISINTAEFVFIVGRSGSGKTTLLNLIAGLLEPTTGSVLFNGQDITQISDTKKSYYRNESIGFVPQSLGALPNLSVVDNVRLPFFLFDRDGDTEGRALSLLEMMGILHLKDEFPNNLSGGEAKRMLIARALMNSPQLLIADEPTANLDAETAKGVMHAIREINSLGTAVLIVTHDAAILDPQYTTYQMDKGLLSLKQR